jgi:preprotein translocase subunit YajC
VFCFALLQAAPTQSPQGGNFIQFFGLMAIIFAIFYFLMIRPAKAKQRRHQEMVSQLKNGDRVLTAGGIFGTVVGVAEGKVTLRIAKDVKVDFQKSSIAEKVETGAD